MVQGGHSVKRMSVLSQQLGVVGMTTTDNMASAQTFAARLAGHVRGLNEEERTLLARFMLAHKCDVGGEQIRRTLFPSIQKLEPTKFGDTNVALNVATMLGTKMPKWKPDVGKWMYDLRYKKAYEALGYVPPKLVERIPTVQPRASAVNGATAAPVTARVGAVVAPAPRIRGQSGGYHGA